MVTSTAAAIATAAGFASAFAIMTAVTNTFSFAGSVATLKAEQGVVLRDSQNLVDSAFHRRSETGK